MKQKLSEIMRKCGRAVYYNQGAINAHMEDADLVEQYEAEQEARDTRVMAIVERMKISEGQQEEQGGIITLQITYYWRRLLEIALRGEEEP